MRPKALKNYTEHGRIICCLCNEEMGSGEVRFALYAPAATTLYATTAFAHLHCAEKRPYTTLVAMKKSCLGETTEVREEGAPNRRAVVVN